MLKTRMIHKRYAYDKGISIIEYVVLFVIVVGGFVLMRPYIQAAIFGNWSKTGQSFAFGRQYESPKTIDCAFDESINLWYDRNCAANNHCLEGNVDCEILQCPDSNCHHLNPSQGK